MIPMSFYWCRKLHCASLKTTLSFIENYTASLKKQEPCYV